MSDSNFSLSKSKFSNIRVWISSSIGFEVSISHPNPPKPQSKRSEFPYHQDSFERKKSEIDQAVLNFS